MTDDERDRYRLNFAKRIGVIEISSYGGGHPRSATIRSLERDDMAIHNLSMEEVRDLHYALGRLLELTT